MARNKFRATANSCFANLNFLDAVKPPLAVRPVDLTLLHSVRGGTSRMLVVALTSNRGFDKTSYGYFTAGGCPFLAAPMIKVI